MAYSVHRQRRSIMTRRGSGWQFSVTMQSVSRKSHNTTAGGAAAATSLLPLLFT